MTEFFASARYQMQVKVPGVDGAIIFASGLPRHELERRDMKKYKHAQRRLLDPQLYLAALDAAKAPQTCAILASYGWFGADAPEYDSGEQKQAEWRAEAREQIPDSWTGRLPSATSKIEDRVRQCLELQTRLACEALILPTPLISTPAVDFATQLAWLEPGIELAKRVAPGLHRLASIAISDTCLRTTDPWTSTFLDVLIDQFTSRDIDGIYVVIEQASHDQLYETNTNVLGALLRIVRDVRVAGAKRIIVPLAGTGGLLAIAMGADVWSAGWYRSERRVRLADLEETDENKRARPTYYSNPLAGEIHLKTDLDTINAAGLLDSVADQTDASDGLLRALRSGQLVADVPEWEPRQSNVSAARNHFLAAAVRETRSIKGIAPAKRLDFARTWIDGALAAAQGVSTKGEFHDRTTLSHQRAWKSVLDRAAAG